MSYLFSLFLVLWCLFFPSLLAQADSHPVINEFFPHPSTGNREWVELYVPDGEDATNYWIDDDTDFTNDSGNSTKKQITSVIPGSDSRHVVFELSSSMFNNSGDTVALFAPDGTLVDHTDYSSDPGADVSIGRTPDATGDFQVLSSATRGSPKSSPKPPDTATPVPTDKPTTTPKPTATPKPAKSTVAPTAILAASTKAPAKKAYHFPKQQILIKDASNTLPQIVAFIIGGLLLAGCGILLYLKKQGLLSWGKRIRNYELGYLLYIKLPEFMIPYS